MKKEQITQWVDPNDKITSEYGRITKREWLHFEKERMSKHGGNFFVGIAGKSGLVALFRRITEKGYHEKRLAYGNAND